MEEEVDWRAIGPQITNMEGNEAFFRPSLTSLSEDLEEDGGGCEEDNGVDALHNDLQHNVRPDDLHQELTHDDLERTPRDDLDPRMGEMDHEEGLQSDPVWVRQSDVEPRETGKMKFTVRRYDPVQTAEEVPPLSKHDEEDGRNGTALDTMDGINHEDSITSSFYSTSALGGRHDVAHRGRVFARRHKRRLVFKDGKCNISLANISKRKRRYLGDMFSTILDMKWRWNMLVFALAFLISWLVFALIWWLIAYIHKDHEHIGDDSWDFCMVEVYDFTTALLFSVETQHTIGYGSRSMNTKCPEAVVLLMLQSCTGVFLQSIVTGIIFAKLSRPKGRSHTLMFSKTAVICQRDGKYNLLFRVADMRTKSHIVGAVLRACMVRNRITKEGELLPLGAIPLDVQPETCFSDGNIFLVWPVTVTHIINEESPFWEMSAEQLLSERFEIVVWLEGSVESTGMTCQVRTSYLPSEIEWGYRLAPLFTYQKENGQYTIDYSVFHNTQSVPMPECSAKSFADGDCEDIDGQGQGDFINNYHTENCGVRKPNPIFKHRLMRRNTANGGLSRLEEAELGGSGDGKAKSPTNRRRIKTPGWMNGLVHFWSSSDLRQAKANRSNDRLESTPEPPTLETTT